MCPVYPIEDDSHEILPMLRELFSRWPEARYLAEIAASIEVARTDVDPEAGAA